LVPGIIPVGVFVDELEDNIIALVNNGVIEMIQLHGSENEEYIANLKIAVNKPMIKAVSMQNRGDVQKWQSTIANYILLDKVGGGTGCAFDWNLIGKSDKPYFLAGGLNMDNLELALQTTAPFGVDTSSGVETNGLKDPLKIRAFIRRVRHE
jgi:phosphoribosylanthranilate isomerase